MNYIRKESREKVKSLWMIQLERNVKIFSINIFRTFNRDFFFFNIKRRYSNLNDHKSCFLRPILISISLNFG